MLFIFFKKNHLHGEDVIGSTEYKTHGIMESEKFSQNRLQMSDPLPETNRDFY